MAIFPCNCTDNQTFNQNFNVMDKKGSKIGLATPDGLLKNVENLLKTFFAKNQHPVVEVIEKSVSLQA